MSEVLPPVYHRIAAATLTAALSGYIALNAANYAQAAVERPTDEQVAQLAAAAEVDQGNDEANVAADRAWERILSQRSWHDTAYRTMRYGGGVAVAGLIGYSIYAFQTRPRENEDIEVSISQ